MTVHYQILRDPDERRIVYHWWARLANEERALEDGRLKPFPPAMKAMLRRARDPSDVLLTDAFRQLWLALPGSRRGVRQMPAWACLAAVLGEVRNNDSERTFAASMGAEMYTGTGAATGKPRLSELRFNQLRSSSNSEEFLRRLRRAVHLLYRSVHVLSLSDDVLHWHRERGAGFVLRPDRQLSVRWANEYFTELFRYQKLSNAG